MTTLTKNKQHVAFYFVVALLIIPFGLFARTISLAIWIPFFLIAGTNCLTIRNTLWSDENRKKVSQILLILCIISLFLPFDITFRRERNGHNQRIAIIPIVLIYESWKEKHEQDKNGKIINQDYLAYYVNGQVLFFPPKFAIVLYWPFSTNNRQIETE